jgi:hypothetical protein
VGLNRSLRGVTVPPGLAEDTPGSCTNNSKETRIPARAVSGKIGCGVYGKADTDDPSPSTV